MPGKRSANLPSSALRAVGRSVMAAPYLIEDLHGRLDRDAVLRMNNASAQETSLLTLDRFNQLIDWASVALTIPSATAFVLAFQQSDNYDGGHFLWFRF